METPDKWLVIKIDSTYKVFATWYGGYLDGDAWRLNSGITKVEQDDDFYYFHGYSGSIYKCGKKRYGSSNYSGMILDTMIEKAKKERNIDIEILSGDTDFSNLKHT